MTTKRHIMFMKRLSIIFMLLVLTVSISAQNATQARKILDKTASIIGRKGAEY